MNDTRKIDQSGDMIDFRKLILILWRGKWLILGVAIIAGFIAFLITSFLIPLRYRAIAIITVTTPEIRLEFVEKGTTQMAQSDELLDLTYAELGIADLEGQQSLDFSTIMEYWGKLELEVRADDPDLAANAVNVWADLVYERIYDALGANEELLDALEEEIGLAEASWLAAKYDLDEFLTESRLETIPLELEAAKSSLIAYKGVVDRNLLLISEAQTLELQIEGMDSTETLNPGIVLSLINLIDIVGDIDTEYPLDIQNQDLGLSPVEALEILQHFRAALENQNNELGEEVTSLENLITDLASSLEIEQGQVEDLILRRDLARNTYTELVDQLSDLRIYKNQVDQTLKISTRAVPPEEAFNPGILETTGFVGITAALVAMLGLVFYDWWTVREED